MKIKTETKKILKTMYRCRVLYLMILPPIIATFIFHYIPLYGVQIAFKNYRINKGIWGSEWAGLKYFLKFFNYPYFGRVVWNTLWINIVGLLTFPCAIIFAIMLNEMRSTKLRKTCQMITYAPHFVSTVVVCSMITLFSGTDGLFSKIVGMFGGEYSNILSKPSAFAPLMAISGEWSGLGWGTIIYMAALAGVSGELIEAAKIDGASRMQVIWHVHLPHLKPTIITLFILKIGSMLSLGFEKVFLLQNPMNLEASSIISTYTYEVGLINGELSYSAAIGLFNNLINIILIFIANKVSKKLSGIGMW